MDLQDKDAEKTHHNFLETKNHILVLLRDLRVFYFKFLLSLSPTPTPEGVKTWTPHMKGTRFPRVACSSSLLNVKLDIKTISDLDLLFRSIIWTIFTYTITVWGRSFWSGLLG